MIAKRTALARMLKVVAICAAALSCGASAQAKMLFGIGSTGGLYEIDTTTGAGTLVLAAPGSNSLTTTPTGLLLEISGFQFETIDPGSGTITATGIDVTNLGAFTNITGIAYSTDGSVIYASGYNGTSASELFSINPSTGVATPIGNMFGTYVDIAMSPGGVLYGYNLILNEGLSIINISTGAGTSVGIAPRPDIEAIAFDDAGDLFGGRVDLFSASTSTGVFTDIGNIVPGADIRGLAFADTPEPGTLPVAALGFLALAFYARRKACH